MADSKPATEGRVPAFVKWIDSTTAKTVANKLGVSIWAVYRWRRYVITEGKEGARPDPSRMGAIILAAGGSLTAVDIYPPKPKKPRKKRKAR